jgi:hypothetical protein
MAFWGGLTVMTGGTQFTKLLYLLVNIGLIAAAVASRRTTFPVFGALGCWVYIGQLAYEVFRDSVLFPFALALFGLGMILSTVAAQRRWLRHEPEAG